ncbi:MAG: hypothetical protein WA584_15975 [Pyrinomonadaceae bacterium]
MPDKENIRWFKTQFKTKIEQITRGTPFSVDLLTAIALQETGYLWGVLRNTLSTEEVLKRCVGDTIDAPGRDAFPTTKAKLLPEPRGAEMFAIARAALESIAPYNADYRRAATNPNKFCHGFGIFQYDLQFFKNNPAFFLEKRWYNFDECLNLFVKDELKSALRGLFGSGKTTLTDRESVFVAIAYNTGARKVRLDGDFKQGHKEKGDSGKYYGEYIWEYLQLSKATG